MMSQETVEANKQALIQRMQRKAAGRASANWTKASDVDWDDLEHFIDNCKRLQDKESFDTAIDILTTLKKQVLRI
jgi:hypothetical protein